MFGRTEVLGQPTPGVGARELDLAVTVEQRHSRAGRRVVNEHTDEAPARLRGPQRALERWAGDVEHVAVALGELAFRAPEPGDDRRGSSGSSTSGSGSGSGSGSSGSGSSGSGHSGSDDSGSGSSGSGRSGSDDSGSDDHGGHGGHGSDD